MYIDYLETVNITPKQDVHSTEINIKKPADLVWSQLLSQNIKRLLY